MKIIKTNKVLDGLFGLCVGDALGVPVEFESRSTLQRNPVTDMIGHGTYDQPAGTWSDDSSLTFCLAESLCRGFDLCDISDKFCQWLYEAYWTPYGVVFDVGNTTQIAISRLKAVVKPVEAGGRDEHSNGNGSLMRILPLVFYLLNSDESQQFEITHQVSRLTHGHLRSQMACGIYIQLAISILAGNTPELAYKTMIDIVLKFYSKRPYIGELHHFKRILESDISKLPKDLISSTGYVIDTLEASLWCILKGNSYSETVLLAVNLGEDTDTTAAVAGGLAGLYYGYENIPKKWIEKIAKAQKIIELAEKLNMTIHNQ